MLTTGCFFWYFLSVTVRVLSQLINWLIIGRKKSLWKISIPKISVIQSAKWEKNMNMKIIITMNNNYLFFYEMCFLLFYSKCFISWKWNFKNNKKCCNKFFYPKKWAARLVPIPRVVRALPVSVIAWFWVSAPMPRSPSPVTSLVVPWLPNYKKCKLFKIRKKNFS